MILFDFADDLRLSVSIIKATGGNDLEFLFCDRPACHCNKTML